MSTSFALFAQKKFSAMFLVQFLGAFNDNLFKQGLILALTFIATNTLSTPISTLNNLAALLFILPYFLFSSLAGQLADKYEKSAMTKLIKLLEIAIMLMAAIGFWQQIWFLLFIALFLMGTHSAFFGPIKYAYLPEMMHKNELVGANGLFQMGTTLAILLGMIASGLLMRLPNALLWLSIATCFFACIGYICAHFLPKTKQYSPNIKINYNLFATSFASIRYLYTHKALFFVVLGNSWFWYYGATFLTQAPEFGKIVLGANETVVIFLLALFSVGVAFGSVLCKKISKTLLDIRHLAIALSGLSLFAAILSIAAASYPISAHSYTILQMLWLPKAILIFICLFFIGFFGGLYIVPLYAYMQAFAPKDHRARVVGANNIFNALFMVVSAIIAMLILSAMHMPIFALFAISSVLNFIFGIFLCTKLKQYITQV